MKAFEYCKIQEMLQFPHGNLKSVNPSNVRNERTGIKNAKDVPIVNELAIRICWTIKLAISISEYGFFIFIPD